MVMNEMRSSRPTNYKFHSTSTITATINHELHQQIRMRLRSPGMDLIMFVVGKDDYK